MLQNNYDVDSIIISDIDKKIGIEKLNCLIELGQLTSVSARIQTQASKSESLHSLLLNIKVILCYQVVHMHTLTLNAYIQK